MGWAACPPAPFAPAPVLTGGNLRAVYSASDIQPLAIPGGCDVLYLETPTNPTTRITDIARLSAAAHRVEAVVIVDNTLR